MPSRGGSSYQRSLLDSSNNSGRSGNQTSPVKVKPRIVLYQAEHLSDVNDWTDNVLYPVDIKQPKPTTSAVRSGSGTQLGMAICPSPSMPMPAQAGSATTAQLAPGNSSKQQQQVMPPTFHQSGSSKTSAAISHKSGLSMASAAISYKSCSSMASAAKSVRSTLNQQWQFDQLKQLKKDVQQSIQEEDNRKQLASDFKRLCGEINLHPGNIRHFLTENFRIFPLDPSWMAVLPLVKDLTHFQLLALPRGNKPQVFFFNKEKGEPMWTVPKELNTEFKRKAELLVEKPLTLCLQEPLIDLIFKSPNPSKEGQQSYDAFPGASEEKQILDRRMAKWKVDIKNSLAPPKHFYTYLILDPRKLDLESPESISFFDFLRSIFYIGKSNHHERRPLSYIRTEANRYPTTPMNTFGESFKKGRIHEIWNAGHGPLVLYPFIAITEDEACYREHCMIMSRLTVNWDRWKRPKWATAIFGPMCLTNKADELDKAEHLPIHTDLKEWPEKKRIQAGAFMLLKAFALFQDCPPEQHFRTGILNDKKPKGNKPSSTVSISNYPISELPPDYSAAMPSSSNIQQQQQLNNFRTGTFYQMHRPTTSFSGEEYDDDDEQHEEIPTKKLKRRRVVSDEDMDDDDET